MPLHKLHGPKVEPTGGHEDAQTVVVGFPSHDAASRGGTDAAASAAVKALKSLKPKLARSTHTGKGHARRASRPHITRRR